MTEIIGKYSSAKVFAETLEPSAECQIRTLCDQPYSEGLKIRIMPDVHAGAGCTIGTTMTIGDKIVPNLVGVDIGCAMLVVKLKEKRINLPELDNFIYQNIPCGMEVRERPHRSHGRINLDELLCIEELRQGRIKESIGTLGGGNHFIEVDKDDEENLYLVIHSGSRNPGLQVAQYYQKIAYAACGGKSQKEIPYELAYLTGEDMQNYLHDMKFMQAFADLNRTVIKEVILDGMNLTEEESFTTMHNYVDLDAMILRKGAISAKKGERVLIPMNMRDGSLICTGLGNEDWNYSAPHGAGRLMSRREASNHFTLNAFERSMKGIYTTSVNRETLDECPMVYKPMDEIIHNIKDTVTIDKIIKPIYNFKASEDAMRWRKKKND